MEKILETLILRFLAEYIGKNLETFIQFLSILKSRVDTGDQTVDHAIDELSAWLQAHL